MRNTLHINRFHLQRLGRSGQVVDERQPLAVPIALPPLLTLRCATPAARRRSTAPVRARTGRARRAWRFLRRWHCAGPRRARARGARRSPRPWSLLRRRRGGPGARRPPHHVRIPTATARTSAHLAREPALGRFSPTTWRVGLPTTPAHGPAGWVSQMLQHYSEPAKGHSTFSWTDVQILVRFNKLISCQENQCLEKALPLLLLWKGCHHQGANKHICAGEVALCHHSKDPYCKSALSVELAALQQLHHASGSEKTSGFNWSSRIWEGLFLLPVGKPVHWTCTRVKRLLVNVSHALPITLCWSTSAPGPFWYKESSLVCHWLYQCQTQAKDTCLVEQNLSISAHTVAVRLINAF